MVFAGKGVDKGFAKVHGIRRAWYTKISTHAQMLSGVLTKADELPTNIQATWMAGEEYGLLAKHISWDLPW